MTIKFITHLTEVNLHTSLKIFNIKYNILIHFKAKTNKLNIREA